MAVVATAEVRILADTSRFGADLQQKLQQAFRRLNIDIGDIIGTEQGERQGRQFGEGVRRGFQGSRRIIVNEGRETGRRFSIGLTDEVRKRIERDLRKSVFDSILQESRRSGVDAGQAFSSAFTSGAVSDMFNEIEDRLRLLPLAIDDREFEERLKRITGEVAQAQRQSVRQVLQDLNRQGRQALTVEVDADLSPLERRLRAALAASIPAQGKASGKQFALSFSGGLFTALSGLARGFASLLGGIVGSVLEGEFSVRRIFGGLQRGFKGFQNGISQISNAIRGLINGSSNLSDSMDDVGRAGRSAGQGMQQAGQQAQSTGGQFARVGGAIGSALATLTQFMFGIGTFATLLHALQATIGAAIYIVQVLAGTFLILGSAIQQVLVGGLLLLPGAIAAIAGSMILINRAFDDFGPAADAVNRLKEGFDDLLDSAANRVWSGLSDDIDRLAGNVLPALEQAFNSAADGLNSFFGDILEVLGTERIASALRVVGTTVGNMFEALGPAVGELINAFSTLAVNATPVMQDLAEAIASVLSNFSAWVESIKDSGELGDFFDNMYTTLTLIAGIIGNIVEGFFNLFGFAVEGSQSFLDNIRQATEQFATWSSSSEAGAFVQFLVDRATEFFGFIYNAIVAFAEWASSEEGQALMSELVGFAERLFFFIVDMVKEFIAWAQSKEGIEMMRSIEEAAMSFLQFMRDLLPVFKGIFDFALGVYNFISQAVSGVKNFLGAIPAIDEVFGSINDSIQSILSGLFEAEQAALRFYSLGSGGPRLGPGRTRTPTPNAYGSIVRRPTLIEAGERYLPEVIMPISNEDRVEQLARMSGVDKILERRGVIGKNEPSVTMHVTSNSVNPTIVANKAIDMITRAWSGR